MEKLFRGNLLVGILCGFLSVFVFACDRQEFDPEVPQMPDQQKSLSAGQEIDLKVLEQLKGDRVFELMVKALDPKENYALADSLRAIAKDVEEYQSLLSSAIRDREAPYLSEYEQNRASYPSDLYRYLSYECGLRYRSGQLPLTRSDVPGAVTSLSGSTRAFYNQYEELRRGILQKYGALYDKLYPKCRNIDVYLVITDNCSAILYENYCYGRIDGYEYGLFQSCAELSDNLRNIINLLEGEVFTISSDSSVERILMCIDMYLYYAPYRDAFLFGASCRCSPQCR